MSLKKFFAPRDPAVEGLLFGAGCLMDILVFASFLTSMSEAPAADRAFFMVLCLLPLVDQLLIGLALATGRWLPAHFIRDRARKLGIPLSLICVGLLVWLFHSYGNTLQAATFKGVAQAVGLYVAATAAVTFGCRGFLGYLTTNRQTEPDMSMNE